MDDTTYIWGIVAFTICKDLKSASGRNCYVYAKILLFGNGKNYTLFRPAELLFMVLFMVTSYNFFFNISAPSNFSKIITGMVRIYHKADLNKFRT